ncbi:MAG: hypothetical protein IPM76_24125 [Chloroflexi bacterium]|nr:hypothetical protein [Chloroflexota bacterium]
MNVYTQSAVPVDAVSGLLVWGAENAIWRWLYGEAETGVNLAQLADADWQLWPHGRAFGEKGELAWWEQGDGRYHLRLSLETDSPPTGAEMLWIDPETWLPWGDEATDYVVETLLHGSYDAESSQEIGRESWSEARIPRWLHYPLAVDKTLPKLEKVRAVMVTRPYHHQDNVVILTRLLGLKTWQPTEEAANGR